MIFGAKPVYKYATYNKRKMHTMGRAYPFQEAPVEIAECPIKIVNDKAEIFFNGPIFNTYVLSTEEKVCVLRGPDYSEDNKEETKVTFTKEKLPENKLFTVKVIAEDEKTREVEIFRFDEFFPGYKTRGKLSVENNKVIFHSKFGAGPITLQTNVVGKEVEAVLAQLDSDGPVFAEINNPVTRTVVIVVKDLNNMKIVENENIRGILIGCKDKKMQDEVHVFVKNVYPGSYCFVEDISPGYAEVQLIGRQGDISQVKYRDFIGQCKDKRVSKTMKGMISKIKGNSFTNAFEFKQCKDPQEADVRTTEFETLPVAKKVKINEEKILDQTAAVEFIRQQIEAKVDPKPLFTKYISSIKEHDNISLFYMKYLLDNGDLTQKAVDKILKDSSSNFPELACGILEDLAAIKMIFNKSKNFAGFKKLLNTNIKENKMDNSTIESKTKFIKNNMEFFSHSIDFIYDNIPTPRVVVEGAIDDSYKNWISYLKKESGNYKRNLFRRMVKMNFKKQQMKELFKLWHEFESSEGGQMEEVHQSEQEFLNTKKQAE